jgi:hypothetical protein
MRLTARFLTTVSACCCLLASLVAQAQESSRRSDSFLPGPSDLGMSAKGPAAGLLSEPALGSAIGSTSRPAGRPFFHQFTLSSTQSSVLLSDIGNGGVFAGEKPLADKPCLAVRAYIRTDIANKNLHQNWISAKNSCGRDIKINICYLGSASCILVSVPPWGTKSAIIGYAPTAAPIHYQISLEK